MPIKRNKNLTLLNLPGTYVLNDEDVKLFKREWLCPNLTEAKAVIFVVPDLGENSDHYTQFANKLNEKGFHVSMVDYIGHGKSEGTRYVINDFENVVRDIDTNIMTIRARFNPIPVILFGYSFGAIIAGVTLLRNEEAFLGMMIENPFHEFSSLQKDFLNSCLCGFAGSYLMDLSKLMNKPDVLNCFRQDKTFYNGRLNATTVRAAEKLTETFYSSLSEITLPVLILHGEENEICKSEASQSIIDKCSSGNKNLTTIPNGRHMMHNDSDPEINTNFYSALTVWLGSLITK